jgi:hypothetical protein
MISTSAHAVSHTAHLYGHNAMMALKNEEKRRQRDKCLIDVSMTIAGAIDIQELNSNFETTLQRS